MSVLSKTRTVAGWATGLILWRSALTICLKILSFYGFMIKEYSSFLKGSIKAFDDDRKRERIRKDSWKKAVRRHRLDDDKIAKIRSYYLLKKRLLFLSFTAGVWCVMVGYYFFHLYTVAMASLALLVISLYILLNSFRVWQIDSKELAGIGHFGNDGGWIRAFHWNNGRTVSPYTARFLGFLTIGLVGALSIGQAYATTYDVGYFIDLAKDDYALNMLGNIFGSMGGYFSDKTTPLTTIFLIYNTSVMSAGVIFLAYTAGSGLIQTAHEGEFLGKRFSTIWLPIRLTVGTFGILPLAGGWTGAQLVMFLGTAVGIGMANLGWQAAAPAWIKYRAGVPTYQAEQKLGAGGGQQKIIKNIIESQMCTIGYNNESGYYNGQVNGNKVEVPYRKRLVEEGGVTTNAFRRYFSFGGPGGDVPEKLCGKMEYPGVVWGPKGTTKKTKLESTKDFSKSDVIDAHLAAIEVASKSLLPLSKEYFFSQKPFDKEALKAIEVEYAKNVQDNLGNKVVASDGGSEFSRYMKNEGQSWFFAGGLFFKLMSVNKNIIETTNIVPEYLPPEEHGGVLGATYPGLEIGALRFEGFAKQTMREHEDTDHKRKDGSSKFAGMLSNIMDGPSLASLVDKLAEPGVGFLFRIIELGTIIFNIAVNAVGTVLVVSGAAGGTIVGATLGNGILMMGLGLIVLPLFYVGLTMMIFIPMVPAIMWFGACVTYIVIVFEAFAASPLWMITHFQGEGDGMGHKSAHGYMLILQLILSPILMVMGFLAAWLLTDLLGAFLVLTFGIFWATFESANFLVSFFQFMGVLVAVSGIANGLVQKLFGMVNYVPDQVIAWVGGHAAKFGSDDSGDIKKHIAAVGAHIGGAGAEKLQPKGGGSNAGKGGEKSSGGRPEFDTATDDTGKL